MCMGTATHVQKLMLMRWNLEMVCEHRMIPSLPVTYLSSSIAPQNHISHYSTSHGVVVYILTVLKTVNSVELFSLLGPENPLLEDLFISRHPIVLSHCAPGL